MGNLSFLGYALAELPLAVFRHPLDGMEVSEVFQFSNYLHLSIRGELVSLNLSTIVERMHGSQTQGRCWSCTLLRNESILLNSLMQLRPDVRYTTEPVSVP